MLAFGIVIPVLPRLVEDFVGGDTARAAQVFGVFGTTWYYKLDLPGVPEFVTWISYVAPRAARSAAPRALESLFGRRGETDFVIDAVETSKAVGKPVKTVPVAVKRDHPDELKDLKTAVKDIDKMLSLGRLSPTAHRWVILISRFGIAARGERAHDASHSLRLGVPPRYDDAVRAA